MGRVVVTEQNTSMKPTCIPNPATFYRNVKTGHNDDGQIKEL